MSLILDVMARFDEAIDVRESREFLLMGRKWQELERSLEYAIQRLVTEISVQQANKMPVNSNALYKLESYRDLLKQVSAEAKRYEAFASGVIGEEQKAYIDLGGRVAVDVMQTSPSWSGQLRRINPRVVEKMVGVSADGAPLFDLLKQRSLTTTMVEGMTKQLIEAVALGYNPEKTARALATGLQGGLTKALTIARTEQIRVYRQASLDQYAAGGVVQYQRHAAKGERTCMVCLALDGQIYAIKDGFASHPNCRCNMVPVINGLEYSPRESAQDWFTAQPISVQQQVLGAHYDAWKNGTKLIDMVHTTDDPVWGPTLRTVPLKDLPTGV